MSVDIRRIVIENFSLLFRTSDKTVERALKAYFIATAIPDLRHF